MVLNYDFFQVIIFYNLFLKFIHLGTKKQNCTNVAAQRQKDTY